MSKDAPLHPWCRRACGPRPVIDMQVEGLPAPMAFHRVIAPLSASARIVCREAGISCSMALRIPASWKLNNVSTMRFSLYRSSTCTVCCLVISASCRVPHHLHRALQLLHRQTVCTKEQPPLHHTQKLLYASSDQQQSFVMPPATIDVPPAWPHAPSKVSMHSM